MNTNRRQRVPGLDAEQTVNHSGCPYVIGTMIIYQGCWGISQSVTFWFQSPMPKTWLWSNCKSRVIKTWGHSAIIWLRSLYMWFVGVRGCNSHVFLVKTPAEWQLPEPAVLSCGLWAPLRTCEAVIIIMVVIFSSTLIWGPGVIFTDEMSVNLPKGSDVICLAVHQQSQRS